MTGRSASGHLNLAQDAQKLDLRALEKHLND